MRSLAFMLLLCLCGPVLYGEQTPTDYELEMHVKVPLRDGVRLDATLYKPTPSPGPLPIILMLSPYPDSTMEPRGSYFASRGYIYAWVDVRGRGDSEGVFNPFAQEAKDGYDVVEWLAKQPWSNGRVAMFGGSYPGGDQWMTASQHPPHLVSIAPVASVRPGMDMPLDNNIMLTEALQWLTLVSGHVVYGAVYTDDIWQNVAKRLYLAKAPFNQMDRYAGSTTTVFQQWVQHPEFDDYWKKMALSREQVAGIALPVLAITGAHDGDQLGTLSFYTDHITATDPSTIDNYYLVIGPWNHFGTREPKQDFGGQHYGTASLLDLMRLHREWYDYTLKSGTKPAFLKKHVAYYVAGQGAECWKYADSLASVSTASQTLYIDVTGGAASIYHSGSLFPSAKGASGGSFVSDPNDLSAAESTRSQPGADLHGNGLIFHSEPFSEDTEIDGSVDLRLWLLIDVPDTDLTYRLYLVAPDGLSRLLTYSILRARYRHSLDHAEPIRENQPEEYHFKAESWFAMRAQKGSQLRLIVKSLNDPDYEKNWNSMKPVADQSGADAHIGHIQLLQTQDHPSTLTLPLGDPSATCRASEDW